MQHSFHVRQHANNYSLSWIFSKLLIIDNFYLFISLQCEPLLNNSDYGSTSMELNILGIVNHDQVGN